MRGNIAFKLTKLLLKKKRFFLDWEREEPHTSHYHCHWRSSAHSRGSSGWRWLSRRWSRTRGKRISSQSWYWETASRRCSSPRHRLPSRRSARHRRSVWVGTSKSYFLGQIETLEIFQWANHPHLQTWTLRWGNLTLNLQTVHLWTCRKYWKWWCWWRCSKRERRDIRRRISIQGRC